jgi:hypothetical protein
MSKWIIFQADGGQPGWETRKSPVGGLTGFLKEYFDFSDRPIPEPGYRFAQFIQVPEFIDPARPLSKTHYREGDWEVTRVECYHATDSAKYDEIVVCYCKFSPVTNPVLHPMPKAKVTAESFGSEEAYQAWKQSHESADVS